MDGSVQSCAWFDWLANAFAAEEQFPRNSSRERRAARRLTAINRALGHPALRTFENLQYWEDARLSLIRASLEPESLVRQNRLRSVRQTERIGVMVLLAHADGASGPVEAVRQAIAKRGCNWTLHRTNARVVGFLRRKRREILSALCFHYEQFKCAENRNKHAAAVAEVKRTNPDASESELFRKLKPFLLEGMERPKGTLTFLTEAEEGDLEELLSRSRTLKSRRQPLPRSTRGRNRRPGRRLTKPQ